MRYLVLALSLCAVAAPAFAQSGDEGGQFGVHRHENMHAIFAQLNLTLEQKAQLKQIHQQNHEGLGSLVQQQKAAREQFKTMLASDSASDSDLRILQQQIAVRRETIASQRLEGLLQVRKILTPEQRQQFLALYQQGK